VVCTVDSIVERMNEKIEEVSDLLGLSEDQAILVLRHFKWNMDKLQNQWFSQERQLRI